MNSPIYSLQACAFLFCMKWKMLQNRRLSWVFLLCLSPFLASCQMADYQSRGPIAAEGFMDLSSWHFEDDGPVMLNGDWEFYWNQLLHPTDFRSQVTVSEKSYIAVPGEWNGVVINGGAAPAMGYATFRLRLKITTIEDKYAFRFQTLGTAFRVFVDGELASHAGVVGRSPEKSVPGYSPHTFNFQPKGETVEIVIQMSNFHHRSGGIWESIAFGHEQAIHRMSDASLSIELFLAGSFAVMGFYHLGLFLMRRKEASPLYFSLLCFLLILYTLTNGEMYIQDVIPSLSWSNMVRIDYAAAFLGIPLIGHFVFSLFPKFYRRALLNWNWAIGFCFVVAAGVTDVYTFSHLMPIYEVIALLFVCYILYVLLRSAIHRQDGASSFILGFAVFFVALINDILKSVYLVPVPSLIPVGFFIFIFSQAFALSSRFSKSFIAVEKLSLTLDEANRNLEAKVYDRTVRLAEASEDKQRKIEELELALNEIKALKGILPICSYCKNIRDDEGSWEQMEAYISSHSDTQFSHGICPDCLVKVSKESGMDKQD
ncbi:MAG: hypothetical protein HOC23_21340 [Halieaceae bacterium]|jgi:hypothetical protein|nr:hypothetical protein [Halieaceae bacterium]